MTSAPQRVLATPGQIEALERELYYRLAATAQGAGAIVEIGTLVGASTVALAQGIRDNPRLVDKRKRLHSFDLFKFTESEALELEFFERHGIALGPDGDFFDAWQANTAEYRDIIEVTKGDATAAAWSCGPIEILFVDGDKSAAFQDAVVRHFYPHLIPGVSLIVEQDFFYPLAHAIPVKAQIFQSYLHPIEMAATTMVSRCIAKIPDAQMVNPVSRLSTTERAAVLKQMALGVSLPVIAHLLILHRAVLLAENGLLDAARQTLGEILPAPATEYVAHHAHEIRNKYRL